VARPLLPTMLPQPPPRLVEAATPLLHLVAAGLAGASTPLPALRAIKPAASIPRTRPATCYVRVCWGSQTSRPTNTYLLLIFYIYLLFLFIVCATEDASINKGDFGINLSYFYLYLYLYSFRVSVSLLSLWIQLLLYISLIFIPEYRRRSWDLGTELFLTLHEY